MLTIFRSVGTIYVLSMMRSYRTLNSYLNISSTCKMFRWNINALVRRTRNKIIKQITVS